MFWESREAVIEEARQERTSTSQSDDSATRVRKLPNSDHLMSVGLMSDLLDINRKRQHYNRGWVRSGNKDEEWHTLEAPRSKKARMSKSSVSHANCFFVSKGIKFVPPGQTVNAQFYKQVLQRLNNRVTRIRKEISTSGKLHHYNAPPHTVFVVADHLTRIGVVTLWTSLSLLPSARQALQAIILLTNSLFCCPEGTTNSFCQ